MTEIESIHAHDAKTRTTRHDKKKAGTWRQLNGKSKIKIAVRQWVDRQADTHEMIYTIHVQNVDAQNE